MSSLSRADAVFLVDVQIAVSSGSGVATVHQARCKKLDSALEPYDLAHLWPTISAGAHHMTGPELDAARPIFQTDEEGVDTLLPQQACDGVLRPVATLPGHQAMVCDCKRVIVHVHVPKQQLQQQQQ